jgi:hypothetical protein
MGLSFILNADQPLLVRLKNHVADNLYHDTGVSFFQKPGTVTWKKLMEESPLCHPLALMALLRERWVDTFKVKFSAEFTKHLGWGSDVDKLASVEHFLKSGTQFFDEDNRLVSHPIPLQFFEPNLKGNEFSFYLRPLYGQITEGTHYTFTLKEIALAFISAQSWLANNLECLYCKEAAADNLIFSDNVKKLKAALPSDLDKISIGKIFDDLSLPEFYKNLWRTIDHDATIPEILRIKLLTESYDKLIKPLLSSDQQNEIEKIIKNVKWEEYQKIIFHPYTFIPSQLVASLAKKAAFTEPSVHMTESLSKDVVTSLKNTAQCAVYANKNIQYLREVTTKLINPEPSAVMSYFIQKILYRVIKATEPDGEFERDFLDAHANKIRLCLIDIEVGINQKFNQQVNMNAVVTKDKILVKEDDLEKDLIVLGHSPYAWQELLEKFHLDVMLQNFSLGYCGQLEKKFVVKSIVRQAGYPGCYEIKYFASPAVCSFKIQHNDQLENMLRDKTRESLNALTLANRVNSDNESEDKHQLIKSLFSPDNKINWSRSNRLLALREMLISLMNPPSPPLKCQEKIELILNALIMAAVDDSIQIDPVNHLLSIMMTTRDSPGFFTSKELKDKIVAFQWKGNAYDRIVRKTKFLLRLIQHGLVLMPINLGELHPALEISIDSNKFAEFMAHESLPDAQINTGEQAIARSQAASLKKMFPREHDQFIQKNVDPQAIMRLMLYLCESEQPEDSLLSLLDSVSELLLPSYSASILSKVIFTQDIQKDTDFWVTRVIFKTLAQSMIYKPEKKLTSQALDKLTLLSFAEMLLERFMVKYSKLIDLNKLLQNIRGEMNPLDAQYIRDEIIPWYHENAPSRGSTLLESKKTIKKKIIQVNKLSVANNPNIGQSSHHAGSASGPLSTLVTAVQSVHAAVSQAILNEDIMKKHHHTPIIAEDTDQVPKQMESMDTSTPILPEPPKPVSVEKENKQTFVNAIHEIVKRFKPVNPNALYYDLSERIMQELLFKEDFDVKQFTGLDQEQGKLLGPEALIKKYKDVKGSADVDGSIIKFIEDKGIIYREADFESCENQVKVLRDQKEVMDKAVLSLVTQAHQKFLDCKHAGHKIKLDLSDMADKAGLISTREMNVALSNFSVDIETLKKNFESAKEELNQAASRKNKLIQDANDNLTQTFAKAGSGIIEALRTFEQEIKAKAQIDYSTNTYAKILAHGCYQSPFGNDNFGGQPKVISELLRTASTLRYSLMSFSRDIDPPKNIQDQYNGLKTDVAILQQNRDLLTLWNPFHWLSIYKIYEKTKALNKQIDFYTTAYKDVQKSYDARTLADRFPKLLQDTHKEAPSADKAQLLWSANQLYENAGREQYEKIAKEQPSVKMKACKEALIALQNKINDLPLKDRTPVGKSFQSFMTDALRDTAPHDSTVEDNKNFLKNLFDMKRPITSGTEKGFQPSKQDKGSHANQSIQSNASKKVVFG